MKKVDLDSVTMWQNLHQFLQTKNAEWNANAPFASAVYELGSVIHEIGDAHLAQRSSSKGITIQRNVLETRAVQLVHRIAACASVLAADLQDPALAGAVSMAPSTLANAKQLRKITILRGVLAAAQAREQQLGAYTLNSQDFAEAHAAIQAYEGMKAVPRQLIGKRALVTERIQKLMRQGALVLRKLDKLRLLWSPESEFALGYAKYREVVHPRGKRHA